MTQDEVVEELRKCVAEVGTGKQFAEKHGLQPSVVSEVMQGHRPPPPSILDAIGLVRVTSYERKPADG